MSQRGKREASIKQAVLLLLWLLLLPLISSYGVHQILFVVVVVVVIVVVVEDSTWRFREIVVVSHKVEGHPKIPLRAIPLRRRIVVVVVVVVVDRVVSARGRCC
jgi:hypothetical protein